MLRQEVRPKRVWQRAIRLIPVLMVALFTLSVDGGTTRAIDQEAQENGRATPCAVAQAQPPAVSPAKHQSRAVNPDPKPSDTLRRKRAGLIAGLIIIEFAHSQHHN
jgi:hypothetical protein